MEDDKSVKDEILLSVKNNLKRYKEWLKPRSEDNLGLSIIKTFAKGLTTLVLIIFSPVLILILLITFVSAF